MIEIKSLSDDNDGTVLDCFFVVNYKAQKLYIIELSENELEKKPYLKIITDIIEMGEKAFWDNPGGINRYFGHCIIFLEVSPRKFRAWLPSSKRFIDSSIGDKWDISSEMINSLIMKNRL